MKFSPTTQFLFGQEIQLNIKSKNEALKNLNNFKNLEEFFLPPQTSKGKSIQFKLLSTWENPSDSYYLGLNGIEIINSKDENILEKNNKKFNKFHLKAEPSSVNFLNLTTLAKHSNV